MGWGSGSGHSHRNTPLQGNRFNGFLRAPLFHLLLCMPLGGWLGSGWHLGVFRGSDGRGVKPKFTAGGSVSKISNAQRREWGAKTKRLLYVASVSVGTHGG